MSRTRYLRNLEYRDEDGQIFRWWTLTGVEVIDVRLIGTGTEGPWRASGNGLFWCGAVHDFSIKLVPDLYYAANDFESRAALCDARVEELGADLYATAEAFVEARFADYGITRLVPGNKRVTGSRRGGFIVGNYTQQTLTATTNLLVDIIKSRAWQVDDTIRFVFPATAAYWTTDITKGEPLRLLTMTPEKRPADLMERLVKLRNKEREIEKQLLEKYDSSLKEYQAWVVASIDTIEKAMSAPTRYNKVYQEYLLAVEAKAAAIRFHINQNFAVQEEGGDGDDSDPDDGDDSPAPGKVRTIRLEAIGLMAHAKQQQLLEATVDETLYGGAAYGGKSYGTVLATVLQKVPGKDRYQVLTDCPGFSALLVVNQQTTLKQPGSVYSLAKQLFRKIDPGVSLNQSYPHTFTFSSGAKVLVMGIADEEAALRVIGSSYQRIVFDEVTTWKGSSVWDTQKTRLRHNPETASSGIWLRMIGTCNPADSQWVIDRWRPWIKTWDDNVEATAESGETLTLELKVGNKSVPVSRTMIHASVHDNTALDEATREEYIRTNSTTPERYARFILGHWRVPSTDGHLPALELGDSPEIDGFTLDSTFVGVDRGYTEKGNPTAIVGLERWVKWVPPAEFDKPENNGKPYAPRKTPEIQYRCWLVDKFQADIDAGLIRTCDKVAQVMISAPGRPVAAIEVNLGTSEQKYRELITAACPGARVEFINSSSDRRGSKLEFAVNSGLTQAILSKALRVKRSDAANLNKFNLEVCAIGVKGSNAPDDVFDALANAAHVANQFKLSVAMPRFVEVKR